MNKIALLALLALHLVACFSKGSKSVDVVDDNTKNVSTQDKYKSNGKIIELTDETFNTLCINTSTQEIICPIPFIIDFNATWCGPCRQIAPILAKLQKEYNDKLQIFSVDIDKCPYAAQFFNFNAIPTLIFVDKEGNYQQITGSLPETELRQNIKQYLKID